MTINPTRILDTRVGLGVTSAVPLGAGQTIDLAVAGVAGVPVNATGVVANVTVAGGTAPSFVTVWPTGLARPTASLLNVIAGVTGYLVAGGGGGGGGGGATSFTRTKIDIPTVTSAGENVQSLSLPAASWLLIARVDGAHNGSTGSTRMECDLFDAAGNSLDHAKMRAQNSTVVQGIQFVSLTLRGIATLATPGIVHLACSSTASDGSTFTVTTANMSAVRVATPTAQP